MSAPEGPPAGPPQQGQPPMSEDDQTKKVLEELLGGELPGAGYLFAATPAERQRHMIQTDADTVRSWLLRAIETMAIGVTLPFGMEKKGELGKAVLELSQSYLLLDPTVDQQGIPVEGPGSLAHAQAAAAHQFPPRVQPNAAEQAIAEKNEGKTDALAKTRGQRPSVQPRIGGT